MKKLLLGAIVLFLFAASISVVEISCQKIHAQGNRPESPAGGGTETVLFTKSDIYSITPYSTRDSTYTDSMGIVRTITIVTHADTTYIPNLYICAIDGSNVRQIPLTGTISFYATSAKLTANGDSIVIVGDDRTYYPYASQGLYTCDTYGAGLKQIVPAAYKGYTTLNDVK
jgi:hypothetical protein